jgi:hypothetical protein
VLLDKEEIVLYGMLVGVGKHCEIDMNVERKNNENFDTAISWRS